MDFKELISNRFSTRSFSDNTISDEDLNYILECGRLAPTAKNNQPVKVLVIKSEEGLKKVDNVTRCRYNAPIALLVCSNNEKSFNDGEHSTYEIDGTIIATHMILAAESKGVNSCFVRLFNIDEVKKEFNISLEPIIFIMLGYKKEECEPALLHYNRKDIKEFIEVI